MQIQYILLGFFLTLWSTFGPTVDHTEFKLHNTIKTMSELNKQESKRERKQVRTLVSTQANTLSQQRWKNRIVIFKTSQEEINAKAATLNQNSAALTERKLLIFAVSDDKTLVFTKQGEFSETTLVSLQEATSRLRNQNCILIGLDGGTKQIYEDLALKQIFADIDGMPMRRSELSNKS